MVLGMRSEICAELFGPHCQQKCLCDMDVFSFFRQRCQNYALLLLFYILDHENPIYSYEIESVIRRYKSIIDNTY